jgi:tetratricopeptide (TPR) repeat protein
MSTYPTNSFIPDHIAALADPLPRKAAKVSPVPIDDTDLKVAKALAEEGKLDEAFAIYDAIYKADRTNPSSVQAAKQAKKALRRIGELVFKYLLIGRFEQALTCVDDEALAAHPNSVNLPIRRAHALMFLGRIAEARAIYQRYLGTVTAHGRRCRGLVASDFCDLSDAGHQHLLMDEIERRGFALYEDEDVAVGIEPLVEIVKPTAEQVQVQVAVMRPVDIESGDRFLAKEIGRAHV